MAKIVEAGVCDEEQAIEKEDQREGAAEQIDEVARDACSSEDVCDGRA